jgi:hypothetical protein
MATTKTRTAIVGGQWKVTIQLEVTPGEARETKKDAASKGVDEGVHVKQSAVLVGDPITLAYGDSYLATEPRNVGFLLARALEERAESLKSAARMVTKK